MDLPSPIIDDRRYQQLVDEMLARVPVHTPEWTNFNHSDPGVTLVQLFAFLAETVLYRANLVPERNRAKFLELLGVPLAPAAPAQGLVTITNERGILRTETLPDAIEVRAGPVPFRTTLGLDVLPVEARAFIKRSIPPDPALVDYYSLLYASYEQQLPLALSLYKTVAFDGTVVPQVDLNSDTVDRSIWIALAGRKGDRGDPADPWRAVRDALGGRTLSLGIVPSAEVTQVVRAPGTKPQTGTLLAFEMPRLTAGGKVPLDSDGNPAPGYRSLDPRADVDVLNQPGIVQLGLPSAAEIGMWQDLDPLEAGVGDLPPALDDTDLADRLITWIRIRATGAASAVLLWTGINAAPVTQLARIFAEPLADGDGTPDQSRRLARAPVLPGSVTIQTQDPLPTPGGTPSAPRDWSETDDMFAAGPEVVVPDNRIAPTAATVAAPLALTDLFTLDPVSGVIQFGDGLHGRRPSAGARMQARYDYCAGTAGNVAAGEIGTAPALPSGLSVTNPVRSWGGSDPETVAAGEKQVPRMLQHRDRMVSADDFESIAWRAPGVDLGRVEVLAAYHPDLGGDPGSAPGVVTLMAIPRVDPGQPDAPRADRIFLNALCNYLDPRRLITTELVLRGPTYKGIWISVGISVASGFSVAEVVEAVKRQFRAFLAPVSPDAGFAAQARSLLAPAQQTASRGWPLVTAVTGRVLLAEAARVAGVTSVADVLLAEGVRGQADVVEMAGLELPRILGLSVVSGDPIPVASLRGDTGVAAPAGVTTSLLPVPVIPENCL
jgi:hypothetical protein